MFVMTLFPPCNMPEFIDYLSLKVTNQQLTF